MFIYNLNEEDFKFLNFASKPIKWKLIDDRIIIQTEKAVKSINIEGITENSQNDDKQFVSLGEKGVVYGFIDNQHLLIIQDDGDNLTIMILNVKNHEILFKIPLNQEPKDINFNERLILITFFNQTEVYAINRDVDRLDISKLDENINHQALWSDNIKIHLMDSNQNQFQISSYNWKDNCFQVFKYELTASNELKIIYNSCVNLSNFDSKNRIPIYCLTYMNNYLIYLLLVSEEDSYNEIESPGKYCMFELRCINIEINKCLSKCFYDLDGVCQTPKILPLPNEDDFLIYVEHSKSAYFTHFKVDSGHELLRSDFELDDSVYSIELISYNLIAIKYASQTWIYDIVKMLRVHVLNDFGDFYMIKSKYLINFHEKLIKVFEMKNEEKSIKLEMPFNINNKKKVKTNENYLTVTLFDNKISTLALNC